MSEVENKPKGPNKKGLIAIAVAGAVIGITFLGKNNTGDVEQVDVAAKPIELGSDPINQISLKDRDAALTQFAKQFESLEQKITLQEQGAAKREEMIRKEVQQNERALKAQVAALKDELIALRANGIESTYSDVNRMDSKTLQQPGALPDNLPPLPSDGGLNFDSLNFSDMAPPQINPSIQSSNPYGPNYFILKPDLPPATASNRSGGNSLNASEGDLFASMSQPAPQNTNYNDPYAGQGQQPPAKQYASAAEAYEDQQKNATQVGAQAPSGPKLERITIPAFSFVEVTTLHGVACPVGANSPGQKSEIPARPVVLPVRGIFRGPNGSSVDVGNIHLMGLCSGRRTSSSKTGRATVRVEQMSYWDETGDAQMTSSTGYIVDTRDNEQDVYGRLDKASGRTLALESAAAAAAAFATSLSQAEYTTQNNLDSNGSTSTSQLTGDASKAAVSQGVAALFTKIANRFEQEANAAIDTVVVEPGIRLRFVTDQPIHIYKPAEAFDIDSGMRDVLL
jgi:hypothetical protein